MKDQDIKVIKSAVRVISYTFFSVLTGLILIALLFQGDHPVLKEVFYSEHFLRSSGFGRPPAMTIGGFRITAYCPGSCCNGKWHGQTALGRSMSYYMGKKINIAAVDPGVIPLGSWIRYGGRLYLAADTGSAIKGRRIDLFMDDHKSTEKFGIKQNQTIEVLKDGTRIGHHLRFFNKPAVFEISYLADKPFPHGSLKEDGH